MNALLIRKLTSLLEDTVPVEIYNGVRYFALAEEELEELICHLRKGEEKE